MNATGIVRRVDDLGRIVLPKEVRRKTGISVGTAMEIFITDKGIFLKKYFPEHEVSDIVKNLMEVVEENCVDLGAEKTGAIRRHIREVQRILDN